MHIRPPAQTRALAIPEIVISILHQMDTQTLMAAQRVCRSWTDYIRRSRSLQEALFFIPVSEKSRAETRVSNPMLAQAFRSAFPSRGLRGSSNADDKVETVSLSEFDLTKCPAKREMYLRPEASWRRMLTQQPPVFTVGLFSMCAGPMGLFWYQEKATRQNDGLRMGVLFEWFVDLGRHEWNSATIAIGLGGAAPVNMPVEIMPPSTSVFTDGINEDWRAMAADFDLVLMTSSASACTDPEGPDDDDWVKSSDGIAWEEICQTYSELGLTATGLETETYNKGGALWN